MSSLLEQLTDKLNAWGESIVLMLPNLGVALIVVGGAWYLAGLVSRLVERVMNRISDHRTLNDLVRKLVRFVVLTAGLLVALEVMHLDNAAKTFLAGAGIVGLALGFAFQDLSANFISGVAMAVRRPMQVGDLIETGDYVGTIERIELRSTFLRTLDGKSVVIPNRKIYENPVTNHSTLGERRVDVSVGVSYGDDLTKVKDVTLAAVEGVKPRLDRPVELFFTGFGSSSIDFVVRFWVRFDKMPDLLGAHSDAVMAIKAAFDEHGITIPFPIRTLDFGIVGGETLREQLADGTSGGAAA